MELWLIESLALDQRGGGDPNRLLGGAHGNGPRSSGQPLVETVLRSARGFSYPGVDDLLQPHEGIVITSQPRHTSVDAQSLIEPRWQLWPVPSAPAGRDPTGSPSPYWKPSSDPLLRSRSRSSRPVLPRTHITGAQRNFTRAEGVATSAGRELRTREEPQARIALSPRQIVTTPRGQNEQRVTPRAGAPKAGGGSVAPSASCSWVSSPGIIQGGPDKHAERRFRPTNRLPSRLEA